MSRKQSKLSMCPREKIILTPTCSGHAAVLYLAVCIGLSDLGVISKCHRRPKTAEMHRLRNVSLHWVVAGPNEPGRCHVAQGTFLGSFGRPACGFSSFKKSENVPFEKCRSLLGGSGCQRTRQMPRGTRYILGFVWKASQCV